MKNARLIFFLILALAAGIRAIKVPEPLSQPSWREADLATITRNYYREGMNPIYPRIDWRGDGPGYVEMEFPLYPWMVAVICQIFGYHEIFLRLFAWFFSLISTLIFISLARYLLSETGAVAASLFFALSPLTVFMGAAVHAEGLMLMFYLLAVYCFIRWVDEDLKRHSLGFWYYAAVLMTMLAILCKATAAHLGILFAVIMLARRGIVTLLDRRVWFFAMIALLPGLLWYLHARGLYTDYGNSLGISNKYHWAGKDLLTNPAFIRGILKQEVNNVWMLAGILLALVAVVTQLRHRVVSHSLCWLFAAGLLYLIAARTTSDDRAWYYHIVSVAPASLLIGAGTEAIRKFEIPRHWLKAAVTFCLLIAVPAAMRIIVSLTSLSPGNPGRGWIISSALFGLAAVTMLTLFPDVAGARPQTSAFTLRKFSGAILFVGLSIVLAAAYLSEIRETHRRLTAGNASLYRCAQQFASQIPEGALILASGGPCRDADGYPTAWNASHFFYWTDRKGFNICEQQQDLLKVADLTERGARFLIAEKSALRTVAGFEADLRHRYRLLDECTDALLFDLASSGVASSR